MLSVELIAIDCYKMHIELTKAEQDTNNAEHFHSSEIELPLTKNPTG